MASFVPPGFSHRGALAHAARRRSARVRLMRRIIRAHRAWRYWTLVLMFVFASAHAQELEPRAYSNAPVGTTFLIAGFSRLRGPVLPDPTVPVENVQADVDIYTLGWARFFSVLGRSSSLAVVLPYAQ